LPPDIHYLLDKFPHGRIEPGGHHDRRGEARSEKTLVPDFIIFTLDSKFPSKALINNTVI